MSNTQGIIVFGQKVTIPNDWPTISIHDNVLRVNGEIVLRGPRPEKTEAQTLRYPDEFVD